MCSTRLPGKALLPVAGYPSAVLAALRAANQGARLVVATSSDTTDDGLAASLSNAGLEVFRGPQEDVLGRLYEATGNLPDEAIVVRLTGDNVFPDQGFVTALVAELEYRGLEFLGTQWPVDGLPYGLSAEAFRASALRRAAREATSNFDREHVCPWMKRSLRAGVYERFVDKMGLTALRCTLDVHDDYERLCDVFARIPDPINVTWRELCHQLAALPDSPKAMIPGHAVGGRLGADAGAYWHGRLVLGTAQLGMPYGSVRASTPPTPDEAAAIIHTAIRHGVTHIDTARAYGKGEACIGSALADGWASRVEVITKLEPLDGLADDADDAMVRRAVDASINQSRGELGLSTLPVLLLHRARHRAAWRGAVWSRLLELRDDGAIGRLGVSVQSAEELYAVADDPDIVHIQLPYNILDNRWDEVRLTDMRSRRPDLVLHARSVLLQGVLAANASAWPRLDGVSADELIRWLDDTAAALGRLGRIDLCLAYVGAQDWLDGVIVGVETLTQLTEIADFFTVEPLDADICRRIRTERPTVPVTLLDPSQWTVPSRQQ